YLCLPLSRAGAPEVNLDGGRMITRYRPEDYEAVDSNTGSDEAAPLQIGRLNLRLALEGTDLAGYAVVGLARIQETRADKSVVLDENYIPPSLHCGASAALIGFVEELRGMLN